MDVKLFPINNKIKNAITIINGIDDKKFPLLLTHINDKLSNHDEFEEEEIKKLVSSLKINYNDIHLVISTIQYIHTEIDRFVIKPTTLQEKLMALNISESKAETFVKIWMSNNKELFDDLCSGSFENPKKLEDFMWQLSLQLCSKTQEKQKEPTALLQFDLSQDNTKDTFHIEMDHEELSAFYIQLETIQQKLDSLKS